MRILLDVSREEHAAILVGLRMLAAYVDDVSSPSEVTENWPQFYDEGLTCPTSLELDELCEQVNCCSVDKDTGDDEDDEVEDANR